MKAEIRMKLPSLNDYIRACRSNRFQGSEMKREVEEGIIFYLRDLPTFTEPVRIHFHWVEGTKRRDLDNIAYGKKFILDALVKAGKLKDDNRKIVTGFTDTFGYGKETMVIIDILEAEQ